MTITWTITQTDYLTSNGFITTAHWTATAVDGTRTTMVGDQAVTTPEYTASVYSTCSFAPAEPAIPYASVTEAEVLDWIWANGVDKTATEASLAAQIESLKNPTTATGVPW
jgi:hypothetical protein